MANKYSYQFQGSLQRGLVYIYGEILLTTAGAVGSVGGKGISSVAKAGTGIYTITLDDTYPIVRKIAGFIEYPTASFALPLTPSVPVIVRPYNIPTLVASTTSEPAKTTSFNIELGKIDSTGYVAVDGISGSTVFIEVVLQNCDWLS